MTPIYRPENCNAAFQLNWSVSVFGRINFPPAEEWTESLRDATELDGIRLLEARLLRPNAAQFLVSTRPMSSPSEIVRSVKGRWQYLLRARFPSSLRRNYFIGSVGDAHSQTLDKYVATQPNRHPMADDRVTTRLSALAFYDPKVRLDEIRTSNHGQFVYGLQVVVENAHSWNETNQEILTASREMIVRVAASKGWQLSRIGLLSDHIHILLGCGVTDSPESVALSLLNNLAYAQQMTPAFRFSYYVGTFGAYDRDAIRNHHGREEADQA